MRIPFFSKKKPIKEDLVEAEAAIEKEKVDVKKAEELEEQYQRELDSLQKYLFGIANHVRQEIKDAVDAEESVFDAAYDMAGHMILNMKKAKVKDRRSREGERFFASLGNLVRVMRAFEEPNPNEWQFKPSVKKEKLGEAIAVYKKIYELFRNEKMFEAIEAYIARLRKIMDLEERTVEQLIEDYKGFRGHLDDVW